MAILNPSGRGPSGSIVEDLQPIRVENLSISGAFQRVFAPWQVENIFTSRASSGVLTKDLLDIQRREQELGMEVQAVDDNIFHWKVHKY